MTVKSITSSNFDEFVKDGKSVIDFYADWCGPCKIGKPIFEEVSVEETEVKFGQIDVDKEGELAQRFGVMSIPTLIFFKDKEQVDRHTGVLDKEELIEKVRGI